MKWLRSGQSFETNNAQIFSCQKHFQRLKKKLESISKERVQDKLLSNHWKSSELIKSRYSARSCFLCIICNVVLSDTELLLTAKLFLLFSPHAYSFFKHYKINVVSLKSECKFHKNLQNHKKLRSPVTFMSSSEQCNSSRVVL